MVSLAAVFVSSSNAHPQQVVGEDRCVTRQKRLREKLSCQGLRGGTFLSKHDFDGTRSKKMDLLGLRIMILTREQCDDLFSTQHVITYALRLTRF